MYKTKHPVVRINQINQFPHCDERILHAPHECEVCDEFPEWQALRVSWCIAFTGYTPEGDELPCPADKARGDGHKRWPGNTAIWPSDQCDVASSLPYTASGTRPFIRCGRNKEIKGWFCTREIGHDGPCAAVQDVA